MIGHSIGKIFSQLLLIAVLSFTVFVGSELFTTQDAVVEEWQTIFTSKE